MGNGPSGDREEKKPVPPTRAGPGGRGQQARAGTEPRNARSPLRLRFLLSAVFLPFLVAATVLFAVWAAHSGAGDSPGRSPLVVLAAVCAALALTAAVDLGVVSRRLRKERSGSAPE